MRVLVAGGAGQLGTALCSLLLDSGHQVLCVDNFYTGQKSNFDRLQISQDFKFIEQDVSIPFEPPFAPEAIFHLASPASPPEYLRLPLETLAVNSQGTWNLLRIAHSSGARFLYASTSEVYGDPAVHPQPEEYWGNVNPNGIRSCYDESKRFGEALVLAYVRTHQVDARIVRIFNTYGPYCRPDDGRMVPNFISQALRGKPLTVYGSGEQTRSLCYLSDTVMGIRLALESDIEPGTVINIGNPDEHSVAEFAAEIAKVCGVELRTVSHPLPIDDPSRRCPDISKAKHLLGWEPQVSLADGLHRTVDWLRSCLVAA